MSRYYPADDDFQGVRCICGDLVVQMHSDCRSLLTYEQYRDWLRGRPIRDS